MPYASDIQSGSEAEVFVKGRRVCKMTVTNSALILDGSVTLIYKAIAHKHAFTIFGGF